ncbi:hypothetical protein [Streptomyces sp. NPDC058457]|uniref:hypothetical protein n=1 Tax=Streptomyces sp. NPDC058457 TaxID=3346507 RepID=UPI00364C061A
MEDLLRLVMVRPAAQAQAQALQPSPDLLAQLAVVAKGQGDLVAGRRDVLAQWRAAHPPCASPAELTYGSALLALGEWLTEGDRHASDVLRRARDVLHADPQKVVASGEFAADVRRLDDTLLGQTLLSDPASADIAALMTARSGYTALRLAVGGQDPPRTPTVSLPDAVTRTVPTAAADGGDGPGEDPRAPLRQRLAEIDAAIDAVVRTARTAFTEPVIGVRARSSQAAPDGGEGALAAQDVLSELAGPPRWQLPQAVAAGLPEAARRTILDLAGDPVATPVPAVTGRLTQARGDVTRALAKLDLAETGRVTRIGSGFYEPLPVVGTDPKDTLPTTHGTVHPVGVGDLLLVREHVKAYEAGEVTHIENILRREHLSRDTRRLERDEQQFTVESETQKEEERDTQSTDRFSLKRETSDTVKTDAQVKAGLTVDAKYGPFVEVKADLQGSYQQVTEQSTKQASEFSKDVIDRAVSKLSEKTRTVSVQTTIREFEETYSHGFDNSGTGADNISGVYQWVDKVSQAQLYNYGKRMLFDVVAPEPAAFYIWAQQRGRAEAVQISKPPALTITPGDLDEGNYLVYAQAYGATGIDPPPALHKTISQAWDVTVAADPHLFTKSGTVVVDEGYAATWAGTAAAWNYPSDQTPFIRIIVANASLAPGDTTLLAGEEGSLAVGLFASKVNAVTATLEILAERTDRAWAQWQEKAYAAIQQAYLTRKSEYEQALAEAAAAGGVTVTGRNPAANRATILAELRKACVTELTAQQFDAFGALSTDPAGRPQLNLVRTSQQGKYVRFFEQAFEWDHLVYFFYPYFWADKATWQYRSLLDDLDDPDFADFLRAGAARVVFPVRPGFEQAVLYFLDTGLIWDGGDPPDITGSQYVPIVEEIRQAQGAPGEEVAVGDPWEVRVPTSLVKLRADDKLPVWKQDDSGNWVPAN